MKLETAINNRHSTRDFSDKIVSKKIINKIIKYAYKIPSAGDLRPLKLRVVYFYGHLPHLVICADFKKTTIKYGDRGIQYVYMEAGHMAQNICLMCESLGLGSCCIGAFNNDEVKEWFNLEFEPIYMVVIGGKNVATR